MNKIFVIIPSLNETAPVKGAIDLSNHLIKKYSLTLVFLKGTSRHLKDLDPKIETLNLGKIKNWYSKINYFKNFLKNCSELKTLSISYGLSSDLFNFFIRKEIKTISSIRGHLRNTYREDYGVLGFLIAFIHLYAVSKLNFVVVMTDKMGKHIEKITKKKSIVIGNFIDENKLEKNRIKQIKKIEVFNFVFIGRLTRIKRPNLLINLICELNNRGVNCKIDIFGDGYLYPKLLKKVKEMNLCKKIFLHGHFDNVWDKASYAHCLILPSVSEGISRAAIESLYLGIPCVMRNIDSNFEIIKNNRNGILFNKDKDLLFSVLNSIELFKTIALSKNILLPKKFREHYCKKEYDQIIKKVFFK